MRMQTRSDPSPGGEATCWYTGDPHEEQKYRRHPADDANTEPSPAVTRKSRARVFAQATGVAPLVRRQREQWQYPAS